MSGEPRETVPSIPSSILLDFFRRSTEMLDRYSCSSELLCRGNSEDEQPPVVLASLEVLRRRLIQVQLEALHRVVEDYNSSNRISSNNSQDNALSIESVQLALRKAGQSSTNDDDEDDDDILYEPMQAMNEAARLAFARSVLNTYRDCLDSKISSRGEEETPSCNHDDDFSRLSRQQMLDYFGLVIVAVNIDQVQCYLRSGIPIDFSGDLSSLRKQPQDREASLTPEKRLSLLQSLLLRAVLGYFVTSDPAVFIFKETSLFMFPGTTSKAAQQQKNDDEELSEAFENYLSAIRVSRENANVFSKLSEFDQDGVTRVVSVKYSEKSSMAGGEPSSPPQSSFMEEHKEAEQRKDLIMARRAAEMQQTLLAQLLMMNEEDRQYTLRDAKKAHEVFLEEALSIPPGPQRILFMQSIDEEKQKKLVMHKLWESMPANNGGKSPTINRQTS